MKIDALRTVEFEQDDIDPVRQQGENADIQKTASVEAEDAEQKDDNVDQQQDTTGLMGKIYCIHYHKDGDTHLDGCQAGIGHFQIQARAE